MNQRKYLEAAQKQLDVGPVQMARLLRTPFNTYKAWLYERNPLPGVATVAIKLLSEQSRAISGAVCPK